MEPSTDDIRTPTILVVDDDRGTVELIQMMLKIRGYKVILAYSGVDAIKQLQDLIKTHTHWQPLPIDTILLDIMMPGIDGFKVCQHVKNDPVLKYIPVIMVTALENVSDKVAAVEFGADGYITKPFLPEELGSVIKAKLQIKRREEELLRRNAELEAIAQVTAAAASTLDPQRVIEQSITKLLTTTDLSAAAVYILDQNEERLERVFQQGVKRPKILDIDNSTSGQVLEIQQLEIRPHPAEQQNMQVTAAGDTPLGIYIGIPLQGVEHSLGVLEVYHKNSTLPETHDIGIYVTIGDHIGSALENAQIFQHAQTLLSKSYELKTNSN